MATPTFKEMGRTILPCKGGGGRRTEPAGSSRVPQPSRAPACSSPATSRRRRRCSRLGTAGVAFPDRPAGRARGHPTQAGSTSRQPEIPREQNSGRGRGRGRSSNAAPNEEPACSTHRLPSSQSGPQIRSLSPLGSSLSPGGQSDPDVVRTNGRGQNIKSG
ncbi:unnamed protein product [Nyctereutes procyonoides]|uniref:(raccoon dog) hypothetical protein n=1 Tax=Nyctereutes procyonoides TaxID=34880 RepID=A0A811ZC85_NYCPR|nr:unnamed protein product [Nyctereutes procyonoides]